MKLCIICKEEITTTALKYCSEDCKEKGAKLKAKEWYKNKKDDVKQYNKEYYEKNGERQKAVAHLWYLRNKEHAKMVANEYYRDNSHKWKEYNRYNRQAQVGTAFLGPHADVDFDKELKKLEKEKRRLKLSF